MDHRIPHLVVELHAMNGMVSSRERYFCIEEFRNFNINVGRVAINKQNYRPFGGNMVNKMVGNPAIKRFHPAII